MSLVVPHGLNQIIVEYGNINHYIERDGTLNPKWEIDKLDRLSLPFTMALGWNPSTTVNAIRCHKKIIPALSEAFDIIKRQDLQDELRTFDGCFAFRAKRGNRKISLHAWGVALDFNAETNRMGTKGNMSPNIVAVFKSVGAVWGGDWDGKNKDPMHFQFASGY